MKRYQYQEPNKCKWWIDGYCAHSGAFLLSCPSYVRYNDDNTNNVPCDFAGYEAEEEKDTDVI